MSSNDEGMYARSSIPEFFALFFTLQEIVLHLTGKSGTWRLRFPGAYVNNPLHFAVFRLAADCVRQLMSCDSVTAYRRLPSVLPDA